MLVFFFSLVKSSGAMGSSNVKTEREDHKFYLIKTCPDFNGAFRGSTASTGEQSYSCSTFCCPPKSIYFWQGVKQVQNTTEPQWRQNRRASKPQGFYKVRPLSWGISSLLIWLVGICPPTPSNNPNSGCSEVLQGVFQSLTGYLYSTYPHGMDEWVWWLLLPQGPASKQPAKGKHLFEDDIMSHWQKEL